MDQVIPHCRVSALPELGHVVQAVGLLAVSGRLGVVDPRGALNGSRARTLQGRRSAAGTIRPGRDQQVLHMEVAPYGVLGLISLCSSRLTS